MKFLESAILNYAERICNIAFRVRLAASKSLGSTACDPRAELFRRHGNGQWGRGQKLIEWADRRNDPSALVCIRASFLLISFRIGCFFDYIDSIGAPCSGISKSFLAEQEAHAVPLTQIRAARSPRASNAVPATLPKGYVFNKWAILTWCSCAKSLTDRCIVTANVLETPWRLRKLLIDIVHQSLVTVDHVTSGS